jgi:hypothetical protein
MSWRSAIARVLFRLLSGIGFVHADLVFRMTERMPTDSEMRDGELVVVENGGVWKWACLKCPGGCGQKISLSLNPERRPRWRVWSDWFGRPSVEPSVHQKNSCRCHFWIRRGKIQWCAGGQPHKVGVVHR